MSSAVERLLWFQSHGPGVGRNNVTSSMDATGVNTLIELVGDDAKVSVLHDNVARDGSQDLLTIFIPAAINSKEEHHLSIYLSFQSLPQKEPSFFTDS